MRTKLLLLLLLVGTINVFAQNPNPGDFRSKNLGPTIYPWNDANSWEVHIGPGPNIWGPASTYPGQNTGTYNVEIRAGHIISDPNTPNTFGVLTINGTLLLTNNTAVHNLRPVGIIVPQNVGYINFLNNCDLVLPANTYLTVYPGGLSVDNPCSANKRIIIGGVIFSTCNGGAGAVYSFDTLILTCLNSVLSKS